jgi:hypothetical protein
MTNMPGPVGFAYWYDEVGTQLECNPAYVLNDFDTEEELATFIDNLKGIPGWYYECDNRIPHPPNPNEWSQEDCSDHSDIPPV